MSGNSISYTPNTNSNTSAIDRRKLGWCLVISGHKYRYYSGPVAPGNAQVDFPYGNLQIPPSSTVQYPTDIECLLDVGPIISQMDDVKGVAAQEPVEVSLIAYNARTAAGDLIHPVDDLMRVAGPRSADRYVRLRTTLTHVTGLTTGVDVEVEEDVSAWTIPGPIHIGQEVIWATGTGGTGTDVDPYKFTGCTRGSDPYWTTQEHVVDDLKAEHPWVVSDVTTWRGRKAWIFVTAIKDDGVEYGWSMYWSGFLDSNPEFDGETIKIRVAPLTAVMNYKLGVGSAARTANIVPGAHRFRLTDDLSPLTLQAACEVEARVKWEVNIPWLTVTAADVLSGALTLADGDAAFLTSLGYYSTLTVYYSPFFGPPVSGKIANWSDPDIIMADDGLDLVTALAAEFAGGAVTVSVSLLGVINERLPLRLVDPAEGDIAIVPWPDALVTAIDVANAWQPGSIDSWADPTGDGGDERLARLSITPGEHWEMRGYNRELSPPMRGGSVLGEFSIYREFDRLNCWAGMVAHQSVEYVRGAKLGNVHPVKWFPTKRDALNARNNAEVWGGEDFSGPPDWFFQPGEDYIGPFDTDIYAGGTPTMVVKGPGTEAHMRITDVESYTLPDGVTTGYWFKVRNPQDVTRREPCIHMPGDALFTAEVVAGVSNSTPPQFILRLLESGIGNGDNGSFDKFPIGCNLPSDLIDDDSFTSMGVINPLRNQDYEAVRGKTIAEQTEGLLLAMGAQVVSVYDPEDTAYGTWKLKLVPIGMADSTSYKCDITDDDMIVQSGGSIPIKTMVDGRTVRSYELKVNYPKAGENPDSPKDPDTINVDTSAERNDAGGDHGEPMKIDLPGVVILEADQAQAAAEIVANLRPRVGIPRIRWIFSIRADLEGAVGLSLGDTVRVTSSYALGIIPSVSPVRVPCRVVGMKKDLWENTLELEVRPYPGVTAGWAPSARITATPTAASVTIAAGQYSPNESDASWFNAGDKVTIFSPGDWAGRTSHEILSVTMPNTITFTAAHGASADDIIRTDDYDQATTDQKGFAFLADSDGLLGADDDPGYLIG